MISKGQRGLYQRLRSRIGRLAREQAAGLWRRLMFRTTVIAITGSVGKSTAKECLAAILAAHGKTLKTQLNRNDQWGVPQTLLAIRPWHRFAVVEIGTETPGDILPMARMVKPDIAIILSVARTHTNSFPALEDTAAEKQTLLRGLRKGGLAILNGDDEHVRPMAESCTNQVVFFGQGDDCHVRATEVSASWPERLHFEVQAGADRSPVGTQLVGTHWIGSVLAALAGAHACRIPLATGARTLADIEPFVARMQPVALPCGAVVIRDEENASPDTWNAMLKVMSESRARRRVLVLSDLSDVKGRDKKRLRAVGVAAAPLVGLVVFVGKRGRHGVNGAVSAGMDPENCAYFEHFQGAAQFLRESLRAGDLVFIKGRTTDHLSRIVFAQYGDIGCGLKKCKIRPVCDHCDKLEPTFDLNAALATPIE